MTGPSGSADTGGKDVHPAQGVMTLTVILGQSYEDSGQKYSQPRRRDNCPQCAHRIFVINPE
jgi:hypothetical protein